MSKDGGKGNIGSTRSGKLYNKTEELVKNVDFEESSDIMDNEENMTSGGENNASESVSTPEAVVRELTNLVKSLQREIQELKAGYGASQAEVRERTKNTISCGDTEFPINIETDRIIDDESEHGKDDQDDYGQRRKNGGDKDENGNGTGGLTLRIPRSGWVKDPFEEIKFFGESDRQNYLFKSV